MNDIYLKLANSQYTQPIFHALNLPLPIQLKRDPDNSLSSLTGKYLVAATKGNFALANVLKLLDTESSNISLARSISSIYKLVATPANFQSTIKELQVENLDSQKFNGLVIDATGIKDTNDLQTIYFVTNKAIKHIKNNGRIVIISRTGTSSLDITQAAIQGGLTGFVKSISKETGKKGITCNLIELDKGAQKYLSSSLYYLLSPKSCFVTGQSLSLTNQTSKANGFDWSMPLASKIALVTGAAQGVGRETAKILARDGAKVICLDIPMNESLTNSLAREIDGHSLSVDLLEENSTSNIVEFIRSKFGGIDIVVHNAGITRDKTIAKMPEHFWSQVIDINLTKILSMNHALLRDNLIKKNGRIICISSISGIAGNFGQSNYAMSKSAIASYTKQLSQQLANEHHSGITINAIAPGFIETKMTQKIPVLTREFGRRLNALSQGGLPLDIAETVSFFCHPGSLALNGNLLRVCGQSLMGR